MKKGISKFFIFAIVGGFITWLVFEIKKRWK